MKLTSLLPVAPVLTALALLASPATGLSDRPITIRHDRDHAPHFDQRRFDLSRDHHHFYGRGYFYGGPYPYYGYPYYGYPYGFGPSFSVNINRSYAPDYSDDLAVDVQRELRHRGYYRGSLDGDVGPGTRAAISRYQNDRGLPPTGRIDRNLLRSLGIG
jgi:hypothetical protein